MKTATQEAQLAQDMRGMSPEQVVVTLAKMSAQQADQQRVVQMQTSAQTDSQRAVASGVAAPAHGVEAVGLATPAQGPQGSGGSAGASQLAAQKAARQAEKEQQRERQRSMQELDFYLLHNPLGGAGHSIP